MDDATHLLQYRRFFGLLLSVLPGLVMMFALTFGVIWVTADLIQIPWGWGIGLGGLTFALTLVGWLFLGMWIQRWAEDKSGKFLFALNLPFLLILAGFMGWLFVEIVINAEGPGGGGPQALMMLQSLAGLG